MAWRNWQASVEWEAEVAPAIKDRLNSFLTVVLAKQALLAERLAEATDEDLLAALSGSLAALEMPSRPDTELAVEAVHAWARVLADEARDLTWRIVIHATCGDDARPVQWVALAILLERVCRATLARCPEFDSEGVLESAAPALEAGTRRVLIDVTTHRIGANVHRAM